jgi:hypothetical protein
MGEVGLILLVVFFCLAPMAIAGVGLVILGRAGRRKGYRGPFLLTGLTALSFATLFGGLLIVIIVVPSRILDKALVFEGTFLGLSMFALVLSALVVWLLPRRPERVAGPRRAAFPFAALRNLLLLGGLAVLVSPLFIGWNFGLAVQSASSLFLLSMLCEPMMRRQRTPQAEEPTDLDVVEGAVLLLRGFRDERALFAQTDARHQRRGIGRLVRAYFADNDDEFLTAERYLGPAIAETLGPLVGLGNPVDYLPPLEGSALRYYAPDPIWQVEMRRLMPRVRGFLVLAGRFTKSLAWEL